MSWFWWMIGIYAAARAIGAIFDALYGPPGLWIGIAMARRRLAPQEFEK